MKPRLTITFFLLVLALRSFAQIDDSRIRKRTLKQNDVDSIYKFHNPKDSTDTYLHYMGIAKSKSGRTYKIMTSVYRWGLENHRATSRILIFNSRNEFIGGYYLGSTDDLPSSIKSNCLIFSNPPGSGCDSNLYTIVSFAHGIPRIFFHKCKGEFGDVYTFEE